VYHIKELLLGNTEDTQMSEIEVLTKQERIAEIAKKYPEESLKSLAHHMDERWLYEAYRQTRKDGAVGIDGVTADDYAENLGANLRELLNSAKSGSYYAPAVRRVHIPKGKGKETRPLGIPVFEDKILQRAVLMLLEPVYEESFLNCSYGFRPERSPHKAVSAMREELRQIGGGWVLDIDIKKYFDSIDHSHLREFLSKRVCDGVLTKLIHKWLKAGIFENGSIHYTKEGTPQGGVISPLLSNLYLHEVLDVWFEDTVKPLLKSKGFMIRFADDVVMGFRTKEDALRVLNVLPKRMGKYGLTLHPEKTRLLCFVKPNGKSGKPDTFNFLGFTHYWGKSRNNNFVIKHKTAKDRLARFSRNLNLWCRENRHLDVAVQHKKICQKLSGHYSYYGLTGNGRYLRNAWEISKRIWKKWLGRRSRNFMTWETFNKLLERYPLPQARIVHSIYTVKL